MRRVRRWWPDPPKYNSCRHYTSLRLIQLGAIPAAAVPLIYSCTTEQYHLEQKMETIRTASRIHPLMAAAAASVIIVSLAGTAAITGLLPNSQSATAPQLSAVPPAPMPSPAPMALAAAPAPVMQQQAPAVRHTVQRPRVVHHYTEVARNDTPESYRAPAVQAAPQPAQPNYLGIGAGALIGGLIGNQVGGGNGKKLATVAGVIGGGMLGNEVANRNK
jgi:uncharacterized protein YcfJ